MFKNVYSYIDTPINSAPTENVRVLHTRDEEKWNVIINISFPSFIQNKSFSSFCLLFCQRNLKNKILKSLVFILRN